MHAKLDADAAPNQEPQNDHQREIKATEGGGIEEREGKVKSASASQEPDFIAIPHGADGPHHDTAILFVAGEEWIQDANANIESVEDDISGDHDRDDPEPDCSHCFSSALYAVTSSGAGWVSTVPDPVSMSR